MQTLEKFAFNLQLQPYQILTNDVQIIILCLSYFVATVLDEIFEKRISVPDTEMMAQHDSIRDREQPSRFISQYYSLLNINIVYIRARAHDLILNMEFPMVTKEEILVIVFVNSGPTMQCWRICSLVFWLFCIAVGSANDRKDFLKM